MIFFEGDVPGGPSLEVHVGSLYRDKKRMIGLNQRLGLGLQCGWGRD